jgi:hypothetical protein
MLHTLSVYWLSMGENVIIMVENYQSRGVVLRSVPEYLLVCCHRMARRWPSSFVRFAINLEY